MSAWIVEEGHIDVLINAAGEYGLLDGKDPRELGQMLWRENHRSVNARYGERSRTPRYQLKTTEAPLHPIAVLKAIACYDYQSCEHAGWNNSAARKLTGALDSAIAARHPALFEQVPDAMFRGTRMTDAYHQSPVYDRAPWGFTRLDQAHASNYEKAVRP
jgi:hypothetical protein